MTLAQQVSKIVAATLISFGFTPKTDNQGQTATTAAGPPVVTGGSDGAVTAEMRALIAEQVAEQVGKAKDELAKAKEDLAAATAKITALEADKARLTAENEKLKTDNKALETRLADPKGEAGRQSAQVLASLHVQPVKTGAEALSTAQDAPEALRDQYNALTDYKARGEFYLKHKDKLLKAPAGKLTAAK